VIVGTDVETDTPVRIGFEERCGGLYILGQPRTGKSNLLVGLALSDIRRNHGILFIDPHTDAINVTAHRLGQE
jgi:DNA replication protein DnaC